MSTPLPGIARLLIGGHANSASFDYASFEYLIHRVKGANPSDTMVVSESTLDSSLSKFSRNGHTLTYTFNGGVIDFVNETSSNKVINTYELYIGSNPTIDTSSTLVSYGIFSPKTIPPAGIWRQNSVELFSLREPFTSGSALSAIGMAKLVERGLRESAAVAHTGSLYHIVQYDPGTGSLTTILRTDVLGAGPGDSGEWFEMIIDPQDQGQVTSGASELIQYLGSDLTWTNNVGVAITLERYILSTDNAGTEKVTETLLQGTLNVGETLRIEDIKIQFNFGT